MRKILRSRSGAIARLSQEEQDGRKAKQTATLVGKWPPIIGVPSKLKLRRSAQKSWKDQK